jgi:YHS domain-containing protein
MNMAKKHLGSLVLLGCALVLTTVVVVGCKKKSEPAAPAETKEVASAAVEQTMCPVMEGPVNQNIFTEYKGKKVYFCCSDCKAKFEADPEKYIAKLPQFKQ